MKQYYSIISAAANRSISQIPQYTCPSIPHSAPFRTKMSTFLLLMVRYGTGALWDFRIRQVLTSQKIRSIILWWWEGAWKRSRPFLCSPVASIILFSVTHGGFRTFPWLWDYEEHGIFLLLFHCLPAVSCVWFRKQYAAYGQHFVWWAHQFPCIFGQTVLGIDLKRDEIVYHGTNWA